MAQRTTKSQVNGYRFLVRRLEHALVRRDVRMISDPMGSQLRSFSVGVVITVLILGVAVALAFFKPQGSVGDAKILVSKNSGALYALVGDVLHPAMNLASARLATGSSEVPTSVKENLLDKFSRGPLIGIAGAPWSLDAHGTDSPSRWSVCDKATNPKNPQTSLSVGVIVGDVDAESHTSLTGAEALLVSVDGHDYLLYNNTRAAVDTSEYAVAAPLNLQNVTPRPVSKAVLNSIPAVPALTVPTIESAGKPSKYQLGTAQIGAILSSDAVGGKQLYALLANGVQPVTEVVAAMIQDRYGSTVIKVSPADLAHVPHVNSLPISSYPSVAPSVVDSPEVVCFNWADGGAAAVTAGAGYPVPAGAKAVPVFGGGATTSRADEVYVPPGLGWSVRTTGSEPGSTRADSNFFISDTGVRYGVGDADLATLNMPTPQRAPWQIVSLLPAGPTLSRDAALVTHTDFAATSGSAVSTPSAEN